MAAGGGDGVAGGGGGGGSGGGGDDDGEEAERNARYRLCGVVQVSKWDVSRPADPPGPALPLGGTAASKLRMRPRRGGGGVVRAINVEKIVLLDALGFIWKTGPETETPPPPPPAQRATARGIGRRKERERSDDNTSDGDDDDDDDYTISSEDEEGGDKPRQPCRIKGCSYESYCGRRCIPHGGKKMCKVPGCLKYYKKSSGSGDIS